MNSLTKFNLADLVVDSCPQECDNCLGLYLNELTGHKIVCHCTCHRRGGVIEALNLTDNEDARPKICLGSSSNTVKNHGQAKGEDSDTNGSN